MLTGIVLEGDISGAVFKTGVFLLTFVIGSLSLFCDRCDLDSGMAVGLVLVHVVLLFNGATDFGCVKVPFPDERLRPPALRLGLKSAFETSDASALDLVLVRDRPDPETGARDPDLEVLPDDDLRGLVVTLGSVDFELDPESLLNRFPNFPTKLLRFFFGALLFSLFLLPNIASTEAASKNSITSILNCVELDSKNVIFILV